MLLWLTHSVEMLGRSGNATRESRLLWSTINVSNNGSRSMNLKSLQTDLTEISGWKTKTFFLALQRYERDIVGGEVELFQGVCKLTQKFFRNKSQLMICQRQMMFVNVTAAFLNFLWQNVVCVGLNSKHPHHWSTHTILQDATFFRSFTNNNNQQIFDWNK